MKILAWICVVGVIWNYVLIVISPFKQMPFKIDPDCPTIMLVTGALLGELFFLAKRGTADASTSEGHP
jgi:hypothetical protein